MDAGKIDIIEDWYTPDDIEYHPDEDENEGNVGNDETRATSTEYLYFEPSVRKEVEQLVGTVLQAAGHTRFAENPLDYIEEKVEDLFNALPTLPDELRSDVAMEFCEWLVYVYPKSAEAEELSPSDSTDEEVDAFIDLSLDQLTKQAAKYLGVSVEAESDEDSEDFKEFRGFVRFAMEHKDKNPSADIELNEMVKAYVLSVFSEKIGKLTPTNMEIRSEKILQYAMSISRGEGPREAPSLKEVGLDIIDTYNRVIGMLSQEAYGELGVEVQLKEALLGSPVQGWEVLAKAERILSGRYFRIFYLRHYEGYTFREIAEMEEPLTERRITEGRVRQIANIARRRVRQSYSGKKKRPESEPQQCELHLVTDSDTESLPGDYLATIQDHAFLRSPEPHEALVAKIEGLLCEGIPRDSLAIYGGSTRHLITSFLSAGGEIPYTPARRKTADYQRLYTVLYNVYPLLNDKRQSPEIVSLLRDALQLKEEGLWFTDNEQLFKSAKFAFEASFLERIQQISRMGYTLDQAMALVTLFMKDQRVFDQLRAIERYSARFKVDRRLTYRDFIDLDAIYELSLDEIDFVRGFYAGNPAYEKGLLIAEALSYRGVILHYGEEAVFDMFQSEYQGAGERLISPTLPLRVDDLVGIQTLSDLDRRYVLDLLASQKG